MKKQQTLFLYFSLIVFLISTVGVGVFSHTCKMEGVQTSYFIPAADSCEKPISEEAHPCCKKKEQKLKEDDCCSNKQVIVQLDIDLHVNSFQATLPTLQFLTIPADFLSGIVKSSTSNSNIRLAIGNPPPLRFQNRNIHLVFQQFLI